MKFKVIDRKKRDFNQSKNLVYASYLLVTSLTLLAWNANFKGNLGGFSLPSLLAILAFSFMWVHYLAAHLKANYEPELNLGSSTKLTQYFVLIAIIAHPIAIILRLKESGYGLPPSSFKTFFGQSGTFFISLGTLALIAFLAYELKKYLENKPQVWSKILKLNDLAMVLIVIHGFRLGLVIDSTWFKYVWLFYGISLLYFYYDKYVLKEGIKKYVEVFIIGLLILMLVFINFAIPRDTAPQTNEKTTQTGTSSTQQDTDNNSFSESSLITSEELAAKDGLEGRDCWIALSGSVYDATNNSQWQNGQHTPSRGMAKCGQDLTSVINQSPHGSSVLEELPIVGKMSS